MTLIKGVDSFTAPTVTHLALAKANGIGCWAGYLPGRGIDSTWTKADFDRIKNAGLHTFAYASGNADPAQQKALAAQWGVKGCLDVESGIRGDGAWVQPWLDASGFGFYHEQWGFAPKRAAFHVLAAYQAGDPKASWPARMARPNTPCGWQWCANVIKYGAHIDEAWLDSAIFAANPTPDPPPVPPVPTPPVEEDEVPYLATAGVRPKGETLDPNGQGAVYLVTGDTKRHIVAAEAGAIPQWEKLYGAIRDFSTEPYALDHMLEGPPYDASYPTVDGFVRPPGWTPPGPA